MSVQEFLDYFVNNLMRGYGSGTPIEIGKVEAIFQYPVKSMRGERLEEAEMG
jgi:hypothetical protein